jgi:hypothetical protein
MTQYYKTLNLLDQSFVNQPWFRARYSFGSRKFNLLLARIAQRNAKDSLPWSSKLSNK